MSTTLPARPRAASPTLSLVADASSLAQRLETRTVRRSSGPFEIFPHGCGLSSDERGEIARALRDLGRLLDARCSPERSEAIEYAAEMMISNFKARRNFRTADDQEADAARVADGFLIALDGRPVAAVSEAVRRIIARETTLSPTFVPTATEVAGVVEQVEAGWTSYRARLERLERLAEEPAPEPEREMTDAERDDIRERVARITRKRDRRS